MFLNKTAREVRKNARLLERLQKASSPAPRISRGVHDNNVYGIRYILNDYHPKAQPTTLHVPQ